jgi:hypothetical protein
MSTGQTEVLDETMEQNIQHLCIKSRSGTKEDHTRAAPSDVKWGLVCSVATQVNQIYC